MLPAPSQNLGLTQVDGAGQLIRYWSPIRRVRERSRERLSRPPAEAAAEPRPTLGALRSYRDLLCRRGTNGGLLEGLVCAGQVRGHASDQGALIVAVLCAVAPCYSLRTGVCHSEGLTAFFV
jgi:hypothetical protein